MENLLNIGTIVIVTISIVTYWKIKTTQNKLKGANNIHYKRDQGGKAKKVA
jgi:hypothetical protein